MQNKQIISFIAVRPFKPDYLIKTDFIRMARICKVALGWKEIFMSLEVSMSSVRHRQTGIERMVGPCDSGNLRYLFGQKLIGDGDMEKGLGR